MKNVPSITINLDAIKKGLAIEITERNANTLFDATDDKDKFYEARYQLIEGFYYDYAFNDEDYIFAGNDVGGNIIQEHKKFGHIGRIAPNIYVGTLSLPVITKAGGQKLTEIELEVQSIKSGYRDDYRDMLEFITEKCTDLLLQANSPVYQHFVPNYLNEKESHEALYQKFAFVQSVIGTDEFASAIHRIVSAPVTNWIEINESKDIRQARRFTNSLVKELLKGGNRTHLPRSHYLKEYGLKTLPEKITTNRKIDSVDTPENRFIKHALETLLKFCTDINNAAPEESRLENESMLLIRELESQLHHSIFNDISRPTTLKINSPVLQRKEGYREVMRVWLMFDLAAKLIWKGGEDVYKGGKKDIATLYEYWLFFKLLDMFQSIFDINHKDISDLIEETSDGLNLKIKQGKFIALEGIFNSNVRKLNIRFSYNRSFSGEKTYPESGSWTSSMRPDYTLSIWPHGISDTEAESQELIVHIHFDAKYKVNNLRSLMIEDSEEKLNEEKIENRKGNYKNADLLKMHAYKDAIRRTGGAYVLYPGLGSTNLRGFHEIIPGLGAFSVSPSKVDSGISDLKAFIQQVTKHFINRTSQREKISYRIHDIFKKPPSDDLIHAPLPEAYNENRGLIPDETFVLVGYYKSREHYDWIKKNKLYNFRMGTRRGSLILDKETVSSKYLLLHTAGDKYSGKLWEIISDGPKVISKKELLKKDYPSPSQDNYLIIHIKPADDPTFEGVKWDFKKLSNYKPRRASALPFTTNLMELMRNRVK